MKASGDARFDQFARLPPSARTCPRCLIYQAASRRDSEPAWSSRQAAGRL